jgi:hypothetical protein
MRTYDFEIHGHRMHIAIPWFSGKRVVTCDGTLVSELPGKTVVTQHTFVVVVQVLPPRQIK